MKIEIKRSKTFFVLFLMLIGPYVKGINLAEIIFCKFIILLVLGLILMASDTKITTGE